MDGGPSHKDTLDLKPHSKGAGEFKPIKTSAPGIEISEHLPNIAKLMNHGAILRGMSTAEGAHPRAKYNMHTGYREGQGGLVYPSIGAIVSKEIGRGEFPDAELREHRQSFLRQRLPRAKASAADRQRSGSRRARPRLRGQRPAVR